MEKNRLCDESGIMYRDIKAFETSVEQWDEQLWRRAVNESVDRLTRTQAFENHFIGIFQPKEMATTDSGELFRSFITSTKVKILKRDGFLKGENKRDNRRIWISQENAQTNKKQL